MTTAQARKLSTYYDLIRNDIFAFASAMGLEPTWQQALLLRAVQNETLGAPGWTPRGRIAVKSGQGTGKTTASVIAGLWRTLWAPGAVTVVTAPSLRQCRDVWLTEASRQMEKADHILQQFIKITRSKVIFARDQRWGVWAVTAKDETHAQGYHEKNLTFIVEEASGVDRGFIEQIKGTLSNENALLVLIGNPNTRDCAFYDCFSTHSDMWHNYTFNAEETARDYPHILSPKRNELLAMEYGRDSDVYRVRVLGEFPHTDPNCVMSLEDLLLCTKKSKVRAAIAPRVAGAVGQYAKQFGLDLARFGDDESVVVRRQGYAVVSFEVYSKWDPSRVVARAFALEAEAQWKKSEVMYVPDAGGMGQGALHLFYDSGHNCFEFHTGATAENSQQYANRMTEAWFHLAYLVKLAVKGSLELYLPKDDILLRQLSTRQYYVNKDGKLILESKDDYKDRGFESPDRADAVVMAFYDQVSTPSRVATRK